MNRHEKLIIMIEEIEEQIEICLYYIHNVHDMAHLEQLENELEGLRAERQSLINLSEVE